MLKQLQYPLIRFLIALGLIAVLLFNLDALKIWHNIHAVSIPILFPMVLANILLVALFANRWRNIGSELGIRAPFGQYFRATWASQFAGQFGPTLAMAEGLRYVMIRRYGGKLQALASQVVDRISGQLVLLAIILVGSPYYLSLVDLNFEKWFWVLVAMCIAIGCIGRILFIWLSERFSRGCYALLKLLNPKRHYRHYVDSFLIQLLLIANLGLAAVAVGPEFDIGDFFGLAPLMFGCLTLLPISIADWGTRELSAVVIFTQIGMGAEQIMSFSLVFGFVNLISTLPGVFYAIYDKNSQQSEY